MTSPYENAELLIDAHYAAQREAQRVSKEDIATLPSTPRYGEEDIDISQEYKNLIEKAKKITAEKEREKSQRDLIRLAEAEAERHTKIVDDETAKQSEKTNAMFPEMTVTIDKILVEAKSRALKGEFAQELANDLSTEQANKAFANNTGYKLDTGKVRMELIPPELLFAIGQVLTYGANKYHERNWEQGMSWGRCFGALMRHMWAWWGGQGPTTKNFLFGNVDEETKFSHLWHAGCCIAFLITYEERGIGEDTRLKK